MGDGITVKPNGKYLARVRVGGGKRESKIFERKADALYWIEQRKKGDSIILDMTVDKWFNYMYENLIPDLRINTKLSYLSKYKTHIKPVIGRLPISKIKPYHCMEVLNRMKDSKQSTIDQVRIVMHIIFSYALENGLVSTNPVTKSVKGSGKVTLFKDVRCLSRSEEEMFLSEAKKRKYYHAFAFILQTGLRYSELTGLKWDDIDFDKRTLKVQRAAYFLEDHGDFIIGPPKSNNGYRDIYLTDTALEVLKDLDRTHEFIFAMGDKPVKRANYNMQLKRIAKKIGIKPFSIHKLRHTFATRCMEAGMKPKTLQLIMGHSDITITLNYYVHVADDEMMLEMNKFHAWAPKGN